MDLMRPDELTSDEILSDPVIDAIFGDQSAEGRSGKIMDLSARAERLGVYEQFRTRMAEAQRDIASARAGDHKPVQMRKVSEVQKESIRWLIPNIVPRMGVTLMAGDGGTGKTSLWCDIAAAVSTGRAPALSPVPFDDHDPEDVLFFSSEDSMSYVLRDRLEKAGANLDKIRGLDVGDGDIKKITFGSSELERLIDEYRPGLVIFDPLQSFIPADVNMSQRNAMRDAVTPLPILGEKYGTAFIIILHTNKRQNAWGRNRISDSSDLWDFARSVLIVGDTGENGIRYCSNEKNNYAPKADTLLFRVENGHIKTCGRTDKKDREYVLESAKPSERRREAPARDTAKKFILDYLESGESKPYKDVEEAALAAGISKSAFRRVKCDLEREGRIEVKSSGYGKDKKYFWTLKEEPARGG